MAGGLPGLAQPGGSLFLAAGGAPEETTASPSVRSTIPLEGRVNALIVFVQRKDDFYRHCVDLDGVPLETKPLEVDYGTYCGATPGEDGPRYESWTDDPETEWPAFTLVDGDSVRTLPQFASRIIDPPGTDLDDYTEGSLSHYYWLMSNGQFLRRTRLPRVDHPVLPGDGLRRQPEDAHVLGLDRHRR